MTRYVAIMAFSTAMAAVAFASRADGRLVSRTDFNVPLGWAPKKIMGKTLHPMVRGGWFWTKDWEECPDNIAFFRDVTVAYPVSIGVNEVMCRQRKYVERPPEQRWHGRYTMDDLARKSCASETKRSAMRPDLPFMLVPHDGRPPFQLRDGYDADKASYSDWLKRHPNFIGYNTFSEFESDLHNYRRWVSEMPEGEAKRLLLSRYPLDEKPNRDELFRMLSVAKRRYSEFLFGDETRHWMMNSLECSMSHVYAAKVGAAGLMYEAELGTTSGPWAFGTAFTRGAARQFDLPWIWYGAHLVGGFRRDGTKAGGELEWPGGRIGYGPRDTHPAEPDKGSGRSLLRRQFAYGALAGANFLIPENFHFFMFAEKDGRKTASPYAHDINEVYERVASIDRGSAYTPIAILFTIYDPFYRHGYAVGNKDPFSMNAFAFTLVPTFENDHYRLSDRRRGDLGCLFNSPFGEIWDALSPDAGQDPAAFAKALCDYRAAFLVGEFHKDTFDSAALEAYARGGGTLFVSADQVADGLVPSDLAGVSFSGKRIPAGGSFRDAAGGGAVKLVDGYTVWGAEGKASAKPFLLAESGVPLAFSHDVGRGRVITVAVRRMLPDFVWQYADGEGDQAKSWTLVQHRTANGELTYPIVRYLLDRVQSETMPCRVDGDCQWGVNKTSKGWLFWAFNNKGVVKFVGEPEELNPSAAVRVKVMFKPECGGSAFELSLGPGEYALRAVALD